MSDNGLLYLGARDLLGLVPPSDLVDAAETAARALAAGAVTAPPRPHLDAPGSTLLVMPCHAAGLFSTKLVTVAPGNAARGLPVTGGLLVLADAFDGRPRALLDAGALTAQRTGAVIGAALRQVAPDTLASIGIVGCGAQGTWAAIAAAAVRPIGDIFCVEPSPASFERFCDALARFAPGVAIARCADAADLLARTACVVTATTSAVPVLPDDARLLAGRLLLSLGSYRPSMQELPDTAFRLAGAIGVDSPDARVEVGDLINPLAAGWIAADDVHSLGDILAGAVAKRGAVTIFKSVGHAAYDLFTADLLYRAAAARGIGQAIERN